MRRNLESESNRTAYAVFEEQGRISTWMWENLSKWCFGRIHSQFQTSLNLEFEGQLIHLDGGRQGLCCFGMSVPETRMRAILSVCRAGDLAVISDGTLRIYGREGLIFLNVPEFQRVDLSVTGINAGQAERKTIGRWEDLLEVEGLTLGIEKTPEFLQCSEILAGNETGVRRAVSYLYGRGKGLTPAGDDILVGYWVILQSFSGVKTCTEMRAADRSRQLAEVVGSLTSGTTDVSRAYLDAVCAGYANETLVCLFQKLRIGDPTAIRRLFLQLKNVGHTSGCDTIYGMYLGMKYIYDQKKEECLF